MKAFSRKFGLILGLLLTSLYTIGQSQRLKNGIWCAVFSLAGSDVPVNFELTENQGNTQLIMLNGDRRDNFTVEYRREDSVIIRPETFESAIFAKIQTDGSLRGQYRSTVEGDKARTLGFKAQYGRNEPFEPVAEVAVASTNISGRWVLALSNRSGPTAKRVAVLEQNGANLKGIILTVTGDGRELQGNVFGNRFFLSGFTGSGVQFVRGEIFSDGTLTGKIGFEPKDISFKAVKNDTAHLDDAYSLTFLKPGFEKLNLTLPNLKGRQISLDDPQYEGKVVVIDILGSWCPSCIDQMEFLEPWYKANKNRGVEVVGVAFEAKNDMAFARRTLGRLINRFGIEHEILFGGDTDSANVADKLKALNNVMAFPTTIIIGRDGKVKDIHTGFSGKGTGQFYNEFVDRWNKDLDRYIKEPVYES